MELDMTEKLYYKDVNLKEFTATVQTVREQNRQLCITLDRTAFYPEGGGQLSDSGWLKLSDGTMAGVIDVQEAEEEIWHTVKPDDPAMLQPGTDLTGIINWDIRFDHMQQHSGEHIVSGMICSAFDCNNVGFHMGEDIVTIDYDAKISFEQILEIEAKANEYIWEDHEFEEVWPSKEELAQMEYRSKKELEGDVRITSFPGADTC
ncbi:MAG: alanyl-tRNA editing protein, partial [Lachnospiraceae bacterium]|nr:alanyl-tRNA editing protein [Lachnospiraceae bacterium]